MIFFTSILIRGPRLLLFVFLWFIKIINKITFLMLAWIDLLFHFQFIILTRDRRLRRLASFYFALFISIFLLILCFEISKRILIIRKCFTINKWAQVSIIIFYIFKLDLWFKNLEVGLLIITVEYWFWHSIFNFYWAILFYYIFTKFWLFKPLKK